MCSAEHPEVARNKTTCVEAIDPLR